LIAGLLFVVAIVFTAYIPSQSDYYFILPGFAAAFLGYGILIHSLRQPQSRLRLGLFLALGLAVRVIILFAQPQLSDDIYRFFWDGKLMHAGLNPFASTPSELIRTEDFQSWKPLFEQLNSKDYFTVYPPLSQLMFYAAAISKSVYGASLILCGTILVADIGILMCLRQLLHLAEKPSRYAFLYFLNPLVIIEGCGNAHFEPVCLFFLLLGVLFLYHQRRMLSAIAVASGIGIKLLPAMYMPALLRFFKSRYAVIRYSLTVLSVGLLMGLPILIDGSWLKMLQSLDLYFQSFEFNGSVYYVLRWLGLLITGYNQIWIIVPVLSIITVVLILRRTVRDESDHGIVGLLDQFLYFSVCYLLLATTVHPWYLILPVAFCVFRPKLYILVWSFTVIFSYSLYKAYDYEFHYIWIGAEYVLVALVWWLEQKGRIGFEMRPSLK